MVMMHHELATVELRMQSLHSRKYAQVRVKTHQLLTKTVAAG
jgi:hypothetical protein